MLRAVRLAASGFLATCALAAPAHAVPGMEATFQDDPLLVYNTPEGQANTLNTLQALGVDRIRVSVFWGIVAPDPASDQRPQFDAEDPGAYPPERWAPYDRIVREAAARGIAVNFNITSPGPDWATPTPERADIDTVFEPSPKEFNQFVRALGQRYNGQYVPAGEAAPLPRVTYWSIWNEPNQGAWLAPQWIPDPRNANEQIEASPRLYRELLDAAYDALSITGHGGETILIGETAPKGVNKVGTTRQMKPARFIRQLYCLDDNLQFLQGTSAEVRGCPVTDQAAQMAEQHPALFKATGWAHHPYELTFKPSQRPKDREFFTIANLGDLSLLLRKIYQRYGQPIPGGKRDVPLYLTEFGYQTRPPDPTGVTLASQSAYLNEAEYIAYRNPAVKTLAQFLLVDDKPLPGVATDKAEAWGSTFQSGLRDLDGKDKPGFAAYRFPIHVPTSRVRKGRKLRVWGLVRGAPETAAAQVRVELLPKNRKKWRRLRTVRAAQKVRNALTTTVTLQRSGKVRLAWTPPNGGATQYSRTVTVTAVTPKKKKRSTRRR